MAFTGTDIINAAFRKLGRTATTAQASNALIDLNNLISSLSVDGLFVPARVTENLTLVIGQGSYTILASANFNTARPLRIIDAYLVDSSNISYPLDINMSRKEYDSIIDKTATGRPTRLYYDPQWTQGKIYFDLVPDSADTLVLVSEKPIVELATAGTTITLPDFYKEMFVYNLAIRIDSDLEMTVPQEVYVMAEQSMKRVKNYNSLDKLQNKSNLDMAITLNGKSMNITSG